jgi:hypothetical protein
MNADDVTGSSPCTRPIGGASGVTTASWLAGLPTRHGPVEPHVGRRSRADFYAGVVIKTRFAALA